MLLSSVTIRYVDTDGTYLLSFQLNWAELTLFLSSTAVSTQVQDLKNEFSNKLPNHFLSSDHCIQSGGDSPDLTDNIEVTENREVDSSLPEPHSSSSTCGIDIIDLCSSDEESDSDLSSDRYATLISK